MTTRTLNLLPVPGATLHYEVTGSGPMLLLIADGDSDSGAFDSITDHLSADYTVVAYDPRGNSRSRHTNEPPSNSGSHHTNDPMDDSGSHRTYESTGDSGSHRTYESTGDLGSRNTYDPTGDSGSRRTNEPAGDSGSRYDQLTGDAVVMKDAVAVSTADALALIDLLSPNAPAFLFGTGTGAITGIDLITHHPDRVRMLVAHEPPCIELLPDATDARAFFEDVHDTYLREGVAMAQLLYAGGTGLDEDDLPAPEDLRPEYRELLDRTLTNAETYFAHKLIPFTTYRPDLPALRQYSDKIVPAAGRQAAAHLPARPIAVLSTHLGWPVVTFPGPHTGYASHPTSFATLLAQVLEAELT